MVQSSNKPSGCTGLMQCKAADQPIRKPPPISVLASLLEHVVENDIRKPLAFRMS